VQYPSYGIVKPFRLPDELWEKVRPLIPAPGPKKKPGRPQMDDHRAMSAIYYVLRTGIQWKAIPRSLGAGSTHIRTRGEEAHAKREIEGYSPRRWVVERTHSWLNCFRRILIRWEKGVENYEAILHFACAWIAFGRTGLFG